MGVNTPILEEWSAAGERAGYEVRAVPIQPAARVQPKRRMLIQSEERLGSLLAGGGIIWSAYVMSLNSGGWAALQAVPGPREICALGLLIWLHAKWRRSTKLN